MPKQTEGKAEAGTKREAEASRDPAKQMPRRKVDQAKAQKQNECVGLMPEQPYRHHKKVFPRLEVLCHLICFSFHSLAGFLSYDLQ